MQQDSIIESLRKFMIKCPLLESDRRVNVNYVGESMEYSIDPLPSDPIIKRYVDGGAVKQFQFAFTSREAYDEDARINIENSGFYQHFEEWLEEQNARGRMPKLTNKTQKAQKFETLNSGFLYDAENSSGQYRIECRLIYRQEA